MAQSELAESGREPKELTELRQKLAKLVLDSATDIVEAATEKAKRGHYSVTKLLLSLAGIYPVPGAADTAADHSLADFLCKELGLPASNTENSNQSET